MVFVWRMETPHSDCCAAPGSTQLPCLNVFFQQAPATSNQQITSPCTPHQTTRSLHMSQVPQALPSMGFSLLWNKSEQPPASEPHTYLFNPKGEATSFHLQAVYTSFIQLPLGDSSAPGVGNISHHSSLSRKLWDTQEFSSLASHVTRLDH